MKSLFKNHKELYARVEAYCRKYGLSRSMMLRISAARFLDNENFDLQNKYPSHYIG